MKFIFGLCLFCLAASTALAVECKAKDEVKKIHDQCKDENKDKDEACVIRCMLDKGGLLTAEGKVDMPLVEEIAVACKSHIENHGVDLEKMMECVRKIAPFDHTDAKCTGFGEYKKCFVQAYTKKD